MKYKPAARKNPMMHLPQATSHKLPANKGFTLVELIVSVGLFAIVMLVSVGALLSLTGANRKAQALQSVMNNLNIALDGMVRSIRQGSDYSCNGVSFVGDGTDDCSAGGTVFSFKPFCSDVSCPDRWVYSYGQNPDGTFSIYRSQNSDPAIAITSPEVDIDGLNFYVVGTTPGDTEQPKVVITVEGTAGASSIKTKTTFSIQATAVQRLLDL